MREILTLQFGRSANYLGAHYWNLQDEFEFVPREGGLKPSLDRAYLFDTGGGGVYPRVISVSGRGVGGYRVGREQGDPGCYDTPAGALGLETWDRDVTVVEAEPEGMSDFQRQLMLSSASVFADAGYGSNNNNNNDYNNNNNNDYNNNGDYYYENNGGDDGDDDDEEDEEEDYVTRMVRRHDRAKARQKRQEELAGKGGDTGKGKGKQDKGKDKQDKEEEEEEEEEDAVAKAAESLDATDVAYWSDYCKVLFGPSSLWTLNTDLATQDPCGGFAAFADGAGALNPAEWTACTSGGATSALPISLPAAAGSLLDTLRGMSEAMDSSPSFQFLADASSGFGALSAGVLEGVRDEFGKAEVLYMTVEDRCDSDRQAEEHVLSLALHMASVASQASVRIVPVSLDPSSIESDSLGFWSAKKEGAKSTGEMWKFWQTAALAAAALDTVTSSYRTAHGAFRNGSCSRPSSVTEFMNSLAPVPGMCVSRLDASIPITADAGVAQDDLGRLEWVPNRLAPAEHLERINRRGSGSLFMSDIPPTGGRGLSSDAFRRLTRRQDVIKTTRDVVYGASITLRAPTRPETGPCRSASTVAEDLLHHLSSPHPHSCHSFVMSDPIRVPLPWPSISKEPVETLPVLGSLTAPSTLSSRLSLLAAAASSARPSLLPPAFARADMGSDYFAEAAETVRNIAEAYAGGE